MIFFYVNTILNILSFLFSEKLLILNHKQTSILFIRLDLYMMYVDSQCVAVFILIVIVYRILFGAFHILRFVYNMRLMVRTAYLKGYLQHTNYDH